MSELANLSQICVEVESFKFRVQLDGNVPFVYLACEFTFFFFFFFLISLSSLIFAPSKLTFHNLAFLSPYQTKTSDRSVWKSV
jgi:hypothetical protein